MKLEVESSSSHAAWIKKESKKSGESHCDFAGRDSLNHQMSSS